MQIEDDGWAVENASGFPAVLRVPSSRTSKLASDLKGPLGIVWHWTAGPARGSGFATALANEIRTYDPHKDRAASWHFLVAKDGRVIQSVATTSGSWHVGRPGRIGGLPAMTADKWDSTAWAGRLFANINQATIGVELENSGELRSVDDKFYCWPYWLDANNSGSGPNPKLEIPPSRAVSHGGSWFDEFPEPQEMAATRLLQALVVKYKWSRDVSQYGHIMFDPSRKQDPGPVWQKVALPRVLDRVFGAI